MKCNAIHSLMGLFLAVIAFPSLALQERHLILVRQGGVQALTEQGQEQIKQTRDVLLTHGFDNRSIAAVYTAPDKGSKQCAKQLAELGLFTQNKIHTEKRLGHEKKEVILAAFIDEIERKHVKGHVILIDDNTRSVELIELLTKDKPAPNSKQAYIVPFATRHA